MRLLLLLALAALPELSQETSRDTRAGTAIISGRVTERGTGQPLARFRVSLSLEPLSSETSRTTATVLTDAAGSYRFDGVRAGQYLITATPPEHVASHLPQMFGNDDPLLTTSGPRLPRVQVRAGDTIDANIAVSRSLAIEGRVMTPEGDPLADVIVAVERAGRAGDRPPITTDDRGVYRYYGLPPGRYRVCASPPASDVFSAGITRVPVLKSCVPADGDSAGTAAIDLTTADVGNADIVMRRGRRFTVAGMIIDSAGAPFDGGDISFVEQRASARRSSRVERHHSGRFLIPNVEPGTYVLAAESGPQQERGPRAHEFARQEIVVEHGDITAITMQTRRAALALGVVRFEGTAPDTSTTGLTVIARKDVAGDTPVSDVFTSRAVRDNLTFELGAAPEPVKLALNHAPSGWIVKSIFYRGRDVTEESVVLEDSDDPRAIEIVLTNHVSHITGRAIGVVRGTPTIVLAIRADRIVSTNPAFAGDAAPIAGSALVDDQGAFKLGPVEPGEYYVAAVDRDQWFDVSLQNRAGGIAGVVARADRVTVLEGGQAPITVRVVAVR